MGNYFAQKKKAVPVLALGLIWSGLTTSLYRLRALGYIDGVITTVVPTFGYHQEIATVKQDNSAGFAPLKITSWVGPLPSPLLIRLLSKISCPTSRAQLAPPLPTRPTSVCSRLL